MKTLSDRGEEWRNRQPRAFFKLTGDDVEQICAMIRQGRKQRDIGATFGVTSTLISRILTGLAHHHQPCVQELVKWQHGRIEQICMLLRAGELAHGEIAARFDFRLDAIAKILLGQMYDHLPCVQDLAAWHRRRRTGVA